MAFASVTYTSASGTTFALTNSSGDPIPYLRQADISVTVNGVLQVQGTDYTFNTAGTSIILSSSVSGATVIISRTTDISDATVVYTAGSTLTAQDLNNADNQIRYGLQEFSDTYDALTTGTGDLETLGGFIGSNEVWLSNNAHAATTGAIDNRVDNKINTALTTGTQNTVTTGSNTAASFIPTNNTVPVNGLYLPSANSVAVSTNSTGRLFISDDGKVGIGVSDPSSYSITADDLVIASPGGGNTGIQINITDNLGFSSIWFGSSDGEGRGQITYGHSASDTMSFTVAGSARAQITSTGTFNIVGAGSIGLTQAVSFNGSAPVDSLVIDSSGRALIGFASTSSTALLQIDGDRIRLSTAKTPVSASDTGTTGEVCWDANYIYVCTATDTWKRAALSTW